MLRSWQSSGQSVNDALSRIDGTASGAVRSVDGVAKSVEAFDRTSAGASSVGDKLAGAMNNVSQSASAAAPQTEDWTDSIDEAAQSAREAADASGKLAEAAEDAGEAAEEASDDLEDLGENGMNSIQALSGALASAGIVKILEEIGEKALEAAGKAERFETSIAQLQTIAGGNQISYLTGDISALSRETGQAASGLATVSYNAISAGSAVEDAVYNAGAASKLAVAGFTDTTSALSVLSTTMNSYGEAAGSATEISDSLIMVQNLGVTTVAELSQQMGRAIAVASGYNVSLGNLEAAYISTTKAGINTAMSTTYISGMLSELGNAGSDVSVILQETTGKTFGQLMEQGESLADVLGVLYDSVNGDTEAFMNLWGSTTAGMAAAAIINQGLEQFNENLQAVENSAGATEESYKVMADTTEFAHQRMINSMEQVSIAYGTTINPLLEKYYNAKAEILNGIAEFIDEHPKVVKAASSLAIGIGVVAGAIALAGIKALAAIPAVAAFGTAFTAALGPIGWAAVAIGAVVAAGVAFIAMSSDAEDATERLTYASQEQEKELAELNAQYEEACARSGSLLGEAGELALKISRLEEAYGGTGKTLGKLIEEINATGEAISGIHQSYEDAITDANSLETGSTRLISQLFVLAGQTDDTGANLDVMRGIVDKLNSSYEGLGLTIDETTGKLSMSVPDLYDYIQKIAEQQKKQAATDALVSAIAEFDTARQKVSEAADEVLLSWNKKQEYAGTISPFDSAANIAYANARETYELTSIRLGEAKQHYTDLISNIRTYCEELGYSSEQTEAFIEQLIASSEGADSLADSLQETEAATSDYEEAAASAFQSVKGEIDKLCQAYDDAYNAALESFNGQFGLFDEAQTSADATVENAQKALDSQLAYWNNYLANIEALKAVSAEDLGVTQENYEALMAYVQSGTEEAAGLAASMVKDINAGHEEAVAQLATTLGDVQTKQQEAADSVADWQVDFYSKLDDLSDKFDEVVEGLDLSDEAEAAASDTFQAYIDEIERKGDSAVAAAQRVADRVSAALSSASGNISVNLNAPAPGHAKGTDYAENVFVAGEEGPELIRRAAGSYSKPEYFFAGLNGPELIVGEQGAKVYTNEETKNLIGNAAGASPLSQVGDISYGDTITTSYDRTYDTDYFYDMGRQSEVLSERAEPEVMPDSGNKTIISFAPDFMERIGGKTRIYDTEDTEAAPFRTVGEPDDYREGQPSGGLRGGSSEDTRHIYLDITGSGAIKVSAGMDRETVLELLQENLKPVLAGIIQEEIFEEGDLSYDY